MKKQRKIRFSGAGASYENGAAERAIKTVVTMARTILMHAALRCPEDTFPTDLWQMAMDYAVWVYNRTPDMQSGLSAIEIWSRLRFEPVSETLSNCNVWGCPTYVLEPKLLNPILTPLRLLGSHLGIFTPGFCNFGSKTYVGKPQT